MSAYRQEGVARETSGTLCPLQHNLLKDKLKESETLAWWVVRFFVFLPIFLSDRERWRVRHGSLKRSASCRELHTLESAGGGLGGNKVHGKVDTCNHTSVHSITVHT